MKKEDISDEQKARFHESYIPVTETGCWIWERGVFAKDGYGFTRHNGKQLAAHRYSWFMHYGEIEGNLFVCHKCDERLCVNPDHLFLGTAQQNADDMLRKGRLVGRKGAAQWNAKLTDDQVRAIRADTRIQRLVAEDYGISVNTIGKIQRRQRWTHVQ